MKDEDKSQRFILHPSDFILQKAWSGPVSRILFLLRGEDHSSAGRVTAPVKQPTRTLERERAVPSCPYLVLLRRGFAVPSPLARDAVRSYRTVSPLPPSTRLAPDERSAVCFLLHFPSPRDAWPLASLLPVGVRTFLHDLAIATILRSAPRRDRKHVGGRKLPEIRAGKSLRI